MPITPLSPHYTMENPASVYDEEALTALQLSARTAAKVNETVEAFNKLDRDTNDHLEAQDAAIRKMNDETMPEKVTAEFNKNLNNGTFEDMVDTYAGNLENRVDNLLGSVVEGTTTLDAEVIDLRTGNDGIYPNAGAAVRAQLKNKVDIYVNMLDKNAVTRGQYTGADGVEVVNEELYFSDFIPVRFGTWYINPAYNLAVTIYDSNKNRIKHIWSDKGVFTINHVNGQDQAYFRVYGQIWRLDSSADMIVFGEYPDVYREYGKPYVNPDLFKMPVYADYMEYVEVHRNLLNPETVTRGRYFDGEWHDKETLYQSDLIPYKPGTWHINRGYSGFVTFYNENREYIGGRSSVSGVVTFPNDAAYKYFSFYGVLSSLNTDMVVHGYYPSEYHPYNEPFINPEVMPSVEYNTQYRGKRVMFIGDSRTWYDGNEYGARTKPENEGNICVGYQQTVQDRLGCAYTTNGYNGYTSVQICAQILSMDLSSYDLVVLGGGVNDYVIGGSAFGSLQNAGGSFNANTIYGAWQTAIEYILTNYPDVKIVIATPFPCWIRGAKLPESYGKVKKEIAELYGLPCCDLYAVSHINEINRDNFFCDDVAETGWHLHLNDKGNALIGGALANFIMSV